MDNGVARTLKERRLLDQSLQLCPFLKMGTSLNSRGLRAVPYCIENHFYHIRRPPLNVTIFYYARD